MNRKISLLCVSVTVLMSGLSSCDMAKQAQRVTTLAKCDFRIVSVENINVAGVGFQHVKSLTDLGIGDMGKLLAGFAAPVYPLSLTLNIGGRNPNDREAGLNRLEWILFIDDIEMAAGILDKPFTIPPESSAIIPVDIGLDLKKVLSGKSAQATLNFCMNLAGVGNTPTRFRIKLKPTIFIGKTPLTYPGYITVSTEYSSK